MPRPLQLLAASAALALLAGPAAALDDWLPLPSGELTRIAFGSCASQYDEQPIWDRIVAAKPELFLFLGDAIYGDAAPPGNLPVPPNVDLIQKMRIDYAYLAARPGFVRLRRAVPVLATWDDHDLGKNDGGVDFPLRNRTRELHLEFFGRAGRGALGGGVWQAKRFGPESRRVQVILLDTRSFRSPLLAGRLTAAEAAARNVDGRYRPNDDPKASLLGEAQWRWLALELAKPAELRLLVSSIQVLAGEKGLESWGNFPRERRRLYDLIARTRARGVIALSGDVHFAEISRSDAGPYPLYDFTASPLAAYKPGYERLTNSARVSPAYAEDNFGLVEIDWAAKPAPLVTLRLVGADGQTAFAHEISLDTLK